jgi:hypothetical protein
MASSGCAVRATPHAGTPTLTTVRLTPAGPVEQPLVSRWTHESGRRGRPGAQRLEDTLMAIPERIPAFVVGAGIADMVRDLDRRRYMPARIPAE